MSEQLGQGGIATLAAEDEPGLGVIPWTAHALRRVAHGWWTGWVRYASSSFPWR